MTRVKARRVFFFYIILMSTVVYYVPCMFMVWKDMDGQQCKHEQFRTYDKQKCAENYIRPLFPFIRYR